MTFLFYLLFCYIRYSGIFCLITAPNIYKMPNVLGISKDGSVRSAPSYTMAGRQKPTPLPHLQMPGPGYYDAEYTIIKRKPPMYSMGGKYKTPSDNNMKPGPGAHCPEKVNINLNLEYIKIILVISLYIYF